MCPDTRALSIPLLYSYEEARHASRYIVRICTLLLIHSAVLFMRAYSVTVPRGMRHMVYCVWNCYVVTGVDGRAAALSLLVQRRLENCHCDGKTTPAVLLWFTRYKVIFQSILNVSKYHEYQPRKIFLKS